MRVLCVKKYCFHNDDGECKRATVNIKEVRMSTPEWFNKKQVTVYAPVCGDMDVRGSEA